MEQLSQLAENQFIPETQKQVAERARFENDIKEILSADLSLADEKRAWVSYIDFEISKNEPVRARLLYERALVSLDLDLQFWLTYIGFIQNTLKDTSLVRVKFESRRASTSS